MKFLHRTVAATTLAGLLAVTASCGEAEPARLSPGSGGHSLATACPDPIVVQTNWWPQAEMAALYHLLGDEYTVDTGQRRVTGPILSGKEDTGARIEIRAGGPAVGQNERAITLMHDDQEIMLAMAATDEAVAHSGTHPTLTVVAPLDITPQMIMWDPQTYPQFNTVVDIGLTDTPVLYFEGSAYMEYLIGSGILRRDQVDGSYDGNPARWLAEDGGIAQQGFATNEPFIYEHELAQWQEPVKFQLIHHLGYPVYGDTLMIRADRRDELAGCLSELVPVIQGSLVDYVDDPANTNELIVELVGAYEGFPYSIELATSTREQMLALEIISNGHNSTLGDLEMDRVQEIIDKATPIYQAQQFTIKDDLTPSDLVTNEFIDARVGLGR